MQTDSPNSAPTLQQNAKKKGGPIIHHAIHRSAQYTVQLSNKMTWSQNERSRRISTRPVLDKLQKTNHHLHQSFEEMLASHEEAQVLYAHNYQYNLDSKDVLMVLAPSRTFSFCTLSKRSKPLETADVTTPAHAQTGAHDSTRAAPNKHKLWNVVILDSKKGSCTKLRCKVFVLPRVRGWDL